MARSPAIAPPVIDDDFALDQLREAALLPAVRPHVRPMIKEHGKRCIELFDQHRGVEPGKPSSPHVVLERTVLRLSLNILGKVLSMEQAVCDFEPVIEADWLAHVELSKQKRYRDHITHPARVTALRWWLLHRDGFLDRLAACYVSSHLPGAVPCPSRHPREGGHPEGHPTSWVSWVPAPAGTTA